MDPVGTIITVSSLPGIDDRMPFADQRIGDHTRQGTDRGDRGRHVRPDDPGRRVDEHIRRDDIVAETLHSTTHDDIHRLLSASSTS
ncbi:hypothetical protein LWP59_13875 [Amycolatopsis acidiphila]|uniref:Uncharacterized protein n=1 Tax=Amycolatopsis acidiphila TaxID=715473 RepID=A0A558AJ54_9PSEU|nr:hypothetical protein [Amycolatopsis acidiphila]TVT24231.1 hypothetical protein FNH06_06580 [Amycolatopsis acidiphila]UIJ62639.1 hypothetical protein LWP59_13875 [Amycolatopsis acidiphila]GHG85900.1 hypothetical protein GCM10017788_58930 [Amycolatopsis acidiphila]